MDDTFATFVETLEASLDRDAEDRVASSDDLARLANLSRFHFDRVVKAVAGEPPQQFRRRVLLERSAYRLLTTDDGILDVALDAGYGSHEAYTRAFQRAYGVAPSAWRAHPTRFQIEAPSGVHFHPPGGLRLPAQEVFEGLDLAVRMVEHHVWLVTELVERAQRLTGEQLDLPLGGLGVDGIDDDSLRWLLSRLVGQMEQWTAAVQDREYDFAQERGESAAAMRRRIADVGLAFLTEVGRVSREGRYDETFVDAMGPAPQVVTYGGMIAHVLTYSAHHRLLAVTQLARLGITDLGFGDPKYWIA